MKTIGMLIAWCAKDFIGPALKQAVEYCDEVHVCVAPHSESMRRFDDGTKDIAYLFASGNNKVKWLEWNSTNFHATTKANILNTMLQNSKYAKPGNWIWILDVDEFYPEKTYLQAKDIMASGFDQVIFEEWYFYINMGYCLKGEHIRLFQIKRKDNVFQPTQRWVYATNPITTDRYTMPMFHYGMLTDPNAKVKFWGTEYPGKKQDNKVRWLKEIYRNYNTEDEMFWVELNHEKFGIMSPWFSDSFTPKSDGTLYSYHGLHPEFIGDELLVETDFRTRHNFNPTVLFTKVHPIVPSNLLDTAKEMIK